MSQNIENIKSCYPLFEQDEYQTLFQNKKSLEEAHDAQRVQEVFAWTTTAEYEALNFQREALTVDPAKACQPLGAVRAAVGGQKRLHRRTKAEPARQRQPALAPTEAPGNGAQVFNALGRLA